MSNEVIYILITVAYFGFLFWVSNAKNKKGVPSSNDTFFKANNSSKWYWVAIGMVGASLSGVTFISVPGMFESSGMEYMQIVLGYLLGYVLVAFVLLPLFYKGNYTSIYEFLADKFDAKTQKIGAVFFLVSRVLGASFRIYLVVMVLDQFVLKPLGFQWVFTVQDFSFDAGFALVVVLCVGLIWLYTKKGGLKTVVLTDVLQTLFMLTSLGVSVYFLLDYLNVDLFTFYQEKIQLKRDLWGSSSFLDKNNGIKGLLGGMAITFCMTGLDQDMMQKNLSCKNIKESQWNMMVMSVVLVVVNFAFLFLGALLYEVNGSLNIVSDQMFPSVAFSGKLPFVMAILFLIGLLAAAYSSADSALTSLTTSYCVDIKENKSDVGLRKRIHIQMSVLLIVVVVIFKSFSSGSVINDLLKVATYTYGPLLGMFLFAMLSKRTGLHFKAIIGVVMIGTPLFLWVQDWIAVHFNYQGGSEMLWLNGGLHLMCFYLLSKVILLFKSSILTK